ncbi:leucine--tRNA ligase, partial [Patescibacteria group bacterium]|nr:leucine--tRNA ligase [Patescibacteria group bacterium]
MIQYNHKKIEKRWQKIWKDSGIYKTKDEVKNKKNFYHLVMFPYPSGDLHIGHWYNFAPADVYARLKMMQGFNVMSPIGFDSFGLPAENAAIKRKIHPKTWTYKNIKTMRAQLETMGNLYDWSREVSTSEPEYYKWTQWMFLQMYKNGLAYKKKAPANWCPKCHTVLANEQVVDGKCERCETEVVKKDIDQWLFKITKYADRLLKDIDKVDWPEKTKIMQKNWIGKSEGTLIKFQIPNSKFQIDVFTTRIDTIYGCTYVVVAPEHSLVLNIKNKVLNWEEVEKYIEQAKKKSELQRTNLEKEKTGVELRGLMAINPANKKEVPIFVADYVLSNYGTGAIMAVPAHDERDAQFAKKFNLPVSNASLAEPEKAIKETGARKTIQYHLRDWLISRQRYWGVPIPIIYCKKCGTVTVPEKDLPVLLPNVKNYLPTEEGKSPLAHSKSFVNAKCPKCGSLAQRETDTMDTFVCSSWYFLRYADPKNNKEPFNKLRARKWLPVNMYIGGAEHTVLHLLYSRFFTKALKDFGYIN